jgi:nucleotide-binding universal stress UspA family protein
MKVLLPVSDRFDAKLIIDFVGNYRWLRGTEFHVLHIVGSVEDEGEAKTKDAQASELVEKVTSQLRKLMPNCQVTSAVISGMPIYHILERARTLPANMIVMGCRAERITHPFSAGSVSRAVTLQAPCSVTVIRPPQEAIKPLAAAAAFNGEASERLDAMPESA